MNKGGGAAEAAMHLVALARRFAPEPRALPDSGIRLAGEPGAGVRMRTCRDRPRTRGRCARPRASTPCRPSSRWRRPARSLDDVREEFETHRLGLEIDGESYGDPDLDHFRAVLHEAVNHQARIDQLADRALVAKWPIARIDPTLRALFRAGGAELVALDTPPKVVITEYVAVARAFFPEGREQKFVNAVLDHMAREARPEAFA
jgi:transcription antitermination protein NusB